jgi:hypothetical protein
MTSRSTPAGALAVMRALVVATLGCAGGLPEASPLAGLSLLAPAATTPKAGPEGSLAVEVELPAARCLVAVSFVGGGPFSAEVTAEGAPVPGWGEIDLAARPPGLAVFFAAAPVNASSLVLTVHAPAGSAPPPFELWGLAGDCEDAIEPDPSTLRRSLLPLAGDNGA